MKNALCHSGTQPSKIFLVSAVILLAFLLPFVNTSLAAANDYSCYLPGYNHCNVSGSGNARNSAHRQLQRELWSTMFNATDGNVQSLYLPESWDYANIPQDPSNRLSYAKVKLGKFLFHETALATDGQNAEYKDTWSCATCHHAAAGFKSGIVQGIGEGGIGFGTDGSGRFLADDFKNTQWQPDVQDLASPTILNSAYQDVMLWNGQFGNATNGTVNAGLDPAILSTPGTPKTENTRNLSGLETQAIAGLGVHRLGVEGENSRLQTLRKYRRLYRQAFPHGDDPLQDAGLAIAAFERTVLANRAPFQKFLRGRNRAMSKQELRGAIVFFGKGYCTDCHRGAALSSQPGATENEMFQAIGFADFVAGNDGIVGEVSEASRRGRGGFTGESEDNYKFKIAPLYNLADAGVYGHGGSFRSVREVVEYKNAGVPQVVHGDGHYIDSRFSAGAGLSDNEIDDLVMFLEVSLYDARLKRYVPRNLPSGNCFPVNDDLSVWQLGCE